MVLIEKVNITKRINCLDKKKERDDIKTVCDNCGCDVNKGTLSIHKRRFYCHCQVYNMETKPDFEEWLTNQDYDKTSFEDLLEYIWPNKTNKHSSKHINLNIIHFILLFVLLGLMNFHLKNWGT